MVIHIKFMKKFLLLFVTLLFVGCGLQTVPKPTLDPVLPLVSSSVVVSGEGIPNANVTIYSNRGDSAEGVTNSNGKYSILLKLNHEGVNEIQAEQNHKGIISDLSLPILTNVDLSPPTSTVSINTKIPEVTKNKNLQVVGNISNTEDILIINNEIIKTDSRGNFKIDRTLTDGNNKLIIYVKDLAGNKSDKEYEYTILFDNTKPLILTGGIAELSAEAQNASETKEIVSIDNGNFSGTFPSTQNIPIEGQVWGSLKYLTLDNKKITLNEEGKFFQKIPLYLDFGTNKYLVKAEDRAGNVSIDYLTIEVVRDKPLVRETNYSSGCCKYCSTGKACGDSCISRSYTCHKGPGCACDL